MSEEKNNQPGINMVDDKVLKDKKFICALSYLGILWVVGLFLDKDNPLVRFHVNQGIILSIFSFAAYMVIDIIDVILFSIAHMFSIITSLFSMVYFCLVVAFIIIGIMNVYNDRQKPLPFIGSLFTILK